MSEPSLARRSLPLIISLSLIVVVLLGGVLAADRVAHAIATQRVQDAISELAPDSPPPEVELRGFPFLTQALRGELREVHITADSLAVAGWPLEDLEATLRDVPVDRSQPVGSADLRAHVPGESLTGLIRERTELPDSMEVRIADGGPEIVATVLGTELVATTTVRPDGRALLVDVDSLRLGQAEVDFSGLPSAVAGPLRDLRIPLDDLPDGLEVTGVDVAGDGVDVTARGTGIYLS